MAKKEHIVIYSDGGSRGNPGNAGCGAVIVKNGDVVKELKRSLGVMTNNEAEYEGIILGLEGLKKLVTKAKLHEYVIELKMDSELIERQLKGEYQIKEGRLAPYFLKIWNMQVKDFPKFKVTHIPREKNKEADRLANEAMDVGQQRLL